MSYVGSEDLNSTPRVFLLQAVYPLESSSQPCKRSFYQDGPEAGMSPSLGVGSFSIHVLLGNFVLHGKAILTLLQKTLLQLKPSQHHVPPQKSQGRIRRVIFCGSRGHFFQRILSLARFYISGLHELKLRKSRLKRGGTIG